MQRIVKLSWSPEQYVAKGLERTIGRPVQCANCGKNGGLEAHGYYQRWVSAIAEVGRVIRIRVRSDYRTRCAAPVLWGKTSGDLHQRLSDAGYSQIDLVGTTHGRPRH
jgi:hypothetical protein